MAPTTQFLRNAWAPACSPKGGIYLQAYKVLDDCLRRWNYRPRRADTGAYACRRITGGSGHSLHSYGPGDRFTFWNGVTIPTSLAVDINWQTNPYGRRLITDMPPGMVAAIEAIRTVDGVPVWRWGGHYRGVKDAMHFEIIASPRELGRGIRRASIAQPPREPFTMAQYDELIKKLDTIIGAQMKLEARIEELEKDRFKPTTIRVREIHEKVV